MNNEDLMSLIYNIEQDFNCVNINLIDILNKYHDLKVITDFKTNELDKLSSLISRKRLNSNAALIKKYNNLINAMEDTRNSPSFMELDLNIKRPYFKLIYDNSNSPIILVTKININDLKEVFNFNIYGLYGEGTRTKNIDNKVNYIELTAINRGIFNMIDISTIEVNKYFRQGRGSAILKYLENEVIDGLNNFFQSTSNHILSIEGTTGTLGGYYISVEDRLRFYIKNGFTVTGRRFYKHINTLKTLDNII